MESVHVDYFEIGKDLRQTVTKKGLGREHVVTFPSSNFIFDVIRTMDTPDKIQKQFVLDFHRQDIYINHCKMCSYENIIDILKQRYNKFSQDIVLSCLSQAFSSTIWMTPSILLPEDVVVGNNERVEIHVVLTEEECKITHKTTFNIIRFVEDEQQLVDRFVATIELDPFKDDYVYLKFDRSGSEEVL